MSLTRRTLLESSVALAATATLAGCGGLLGTDPETAGRVESVPAGTGFVTHVDTADVLADDTLRRAIDAQLENRDGIDSVAGALDRVETGTGLDPRGVSEVLAFRAGGRETAVTVLWTDWTDGEVRDAIESETGVQAEGDRDRTIFGVQSGWIAVVEEGVYAVGRPDGVRNFLDLWDGEGESVAGDVRDGYLEAEDGYVRFGFLVDEERLDSIPGSAVYESLVEDIRYGYGAVLVEADQFLVRVEFEATDATAAEDLGNILEAGVVLQQELEESVGQGPVADAVATVIDAVEVTVDGELATVAYREPVADAAALVVPLLTELASPSLGP